MKVGLSLPEVKPPAALPVAQRIILIMGEADMRKL